MNNEEQLPVINMNPEDPAAKQALSEQEYIQKYLEFKNDPENKEKAFSLAKQIVEFVGDNWFTERRLMAKAGLTKEEFLEKIAACNTFGFLVHKTEKMKVGGHWQDIPVFKIVIDDESMIKEIETAIIYYKSQIADLESKVAELRGSK